MYLPVYLRSQEEPFARLADTSRDGLLIISRREIPRDKPLDVSIPIPAGGALDCRITPLWTKKDANPQNLITGCSMEISPDQEPSLERLLQHYSFPNENRNLYKIYQEQRYRNGGSHA